MDPLERTVAELQARTAVDNAAVLALAERLSAPAAGTGLVKWRRGVDFDQPRDEHGRFASTGNSPRRKRKRRKPGFFTNARREAGKVVGRATGRAMVVASPILAALAYQQAQAAWEQRQRRRGWERQGPVVDSEAWESERPSSRADRKRQPR